MSDADVDAWPVMFELRGCGECVHDHGGSTLPVFAGRLQVSGTRAGAERCLRDEPLAHKDGALSAADSPRLAQLNFAST